MHKVALGKSSFSLKAANFFGVFGYISLLLEWTWVVALLAYPAIKDGSLDWIMPEKNPNPSLVMAPIQANNVTVLVSIIVTVACLGIVAYVLYNMPKTIGRVGAKLTHGAADSVVPALTHHRKITKKARLKLTFRTIIAVKCIAILLPVLVVVMAPSFAYLEKSIAIIVTVYLASWALFDFAVQFVITKLAKLNSSQVW